MTANGGEDRSGAALGAVFREAREASGRDLGDVARALHLDVQAIGAIEEGRFGDLPMRPYARGYIRNYARLLGLDADDLAQRFDATDAPSAEPGRRAQRHGLAAAPTDPSGSHAWRYTAIVVVLIVALGGMLWLAWRTQDWQLPFLEVPAPAQEEAAPAAASASPLVPPDVSPWPAVADDAAEDAVEEERVVAEAAVDDASEPSTIAATADLAGVPESAESADATDSDPMPTADLDQPPAANIGTLTVAFDEDSWVSVDDAAGERLYRDLGRAGASFTVSGPAPMSVLVGNAAGVRVEFDGEAVDLEPYARDNVARFMLGG